MNELSDNEIGGQNTELSVTVRLGVLAEGKSRNKVNWVGTVVMAGPGTSQAWDSTSEEEDDTEPQRQQPKPELKPRSDPTMMSPYRNGLRIFKFAGLPLNLDDDTEFIDEKRALKCLGVNLGTEDMGYCPFDNYVIRIYFDDFAKYP